MANKYLKPMLDSGSPRVFNCNEMSQKIVAAGGAPSFFRNSPLNTVVLIKDTVPAADRLPGQPAVGTKIYFPFNEKDIYEGGRTIFLHDRALEPAIRQHFGEDALSKDALAEDMRILMLMNRIPSLDPFLLKDVFLRQGIKMDPAYFDLSDEIWNKIESFMLERFEPLVKAAFPDAMASDDKARLLIDKIWEGRDAVALKPLIEGFRLPPGEALDIFSSWRGIVYYAYQFQGEKPKLLELVKWLKENEGPVTGVTSAENKDYVASINAVKDQLRVEWQTTDTILGNYQRSYDKMFKDRIGADDFLSFLRNSKKTYWELGNSLGKISHGCYCWDLMTKRFNGRKLPWNQLLEVMGLLGTIFSPEKKTTTDKTWS